MGDKLQWPATKFRLTVQHVVMVFRPPNVWKQLPKSWDHGRLGIFLSFSYSNSLPICLTKTDIPEMLIDSRWDWLETSATRMPRFHLDR